jgi:hypothetical protein
MWIEGVDDSVDDFREGIFELESRSGVEEGESLNQPFDVWVTDAIGIECEA